MVNDGCLMNAFDDDDDNNDDSCDKSNTDDELGGEGPPKLAIIRQMGTLWLPYKKLICFTREVQKRKLYVYKNKGNVMLIEKMRA